MIDLKQHLRAKFQQYEIAEDDILVLGVSGGIDSMALLDLVLQIHPVDRTIVCHVDHAIRSDSNADSDFVGEFCRNHEIAYETVRVDLAEIAKTTKTSIEATGRKIRYEFFERIRALEKASFVLTAHHRDDSIETVLLNFIRGTRLRGLSGINERQGTLLRPLLQASKSDIEKYVSEHGIPFREDSTNAELEYLRNRVRNRIIPEMETINPSVRNTIAGFAQYARDLDRMVEWLLAVHLSGNSISENEFLKLPELLQKSLIEKIYAESNGGTIGLSTGNIEEVRRFIMEARGGTVKEIGTMRLEKKDRVVRWKSHE